jgi:hypothetical protein
LKNHLPEPSDTSGLLLLYPSSTLPLLFLGRSSTRIMGTEAAMMVTAFSTAPQITTGTVASAIVRVNERDLQIEGAGSP